MAAPGTESSSHSKMPALGAIFMRGLHHICPTQCSTYVTQACKSHFVLSGFIKLKQSNRCVDLLCAREAVHGHCGGCSHGTPMVFDAFTYLQGLVNLGLYQKRTTPLVRHNEEKYLLFLLIFTSGKNVSGLFSWRKVPRPAQK